MVDHARKRNPVVKFMEEKLQEVDTELGCADSYATKHLLHLYSFEKFYASVTGWMFNQRQLRAHRVLLRGCGRRVQATRRGKAPCQRVTSLPCCEPKSTKV